MSYKSTRIYDFKLLDRLIDYDTLVDNAIAALSEFGEKNFIDGFVSCNLELLYPDLKLVEDSKGGWINSVERLTKKVHTRFSDVDWAITNLRHVSRIHDKSFEKENYATSCLTCEQGNRPSSGREGGV